MNGPLRIEVAICTYNRAAMLERTLGTLRNQRVGPDIEWSVLVVDNNCTDDTRAVVERSRAAGFPVSVVFEPEQGLGFARRRAVADSSAPWIAFVDDDCALADDWIAQVARFVREHPDCGALGGRVVLDWAVEPHGYVRHYPWAYAQQDYGPEPRRVSRLVGAGMVVRRATLDGCGWTSGQLLPDRTAARLLSGGDVEISLRVGARNELWYAPACTLSHFIPAERTTFGYLCRLVYGLGGCRLYEDAMGFGGTSRRWIVVSLMGGRPFARRVVRDAALALRGRKSGADLAVRLSFLAGWLAAWWGFLRSDRAERDAILGCGLRSA